MKPLILLLLPVVAFCAEPDIKTIPWPKMVQEFPQGEQIKFRYGTHEINHRIPADPKIQSAGGSGGPIVEITLRDFKSDWTTTLTTQSVGERILELYHGRPQLEIWSRVGGGSWIRELYRYIGREYRSVRIDEFESISRHKNQRAKTATLPDEFHGRAYPTGDGTLYFVETRL